MFEAVVETMGPVIKVIGVGGGGGNAVEHMVDQKVEGIEFFAANTDVQALSQINVAQTLQIGADITKGLGAGANPEIGRCAAEEDRDNIRVFLEGSDMLFIAVGMGGGTGTGAAPVVAEIAKELGILTVAVVTRPFSFEGKKRKNYADEGIKTLSKFVDSLIIIPNDKLLKVLGRNVSLDEAFSAANDVLLNAVQGISELIRKPGRINVDFADVTTVMSEMGYAMMGTSCKSGENRAKEGAETAFASPLLEDIDLSGAKGMLVNVSYGKDIGLDELETIGNYGKQLLSEDATVVIGTSQDPELGDAIKITVVVAGIDRKADFMVSDNLNTSSNKSLESTNYGYDRVETGHEQNKMHKTPVTEMDENTPAFLRNENN